MVRLSSVRWNECVEKSDFISFVVFIAEPHRQPEAHRHNSIKWQKHVYKFVAPDGQIERQAEPDEDIYAM